MSSSKAQQDEWSGKIGVILAVAGSAVGLGNFLRFPGLAAQYGGGAFMVAYGLMLVLVGVPVAWAEWSIGRRGGQMGAHCAPGVFWYLTKGSRLWKFLGVLAVLGPSSVAFYYMVVEAWCCGYFWKMLTCPEVFATAEGTAQTFFSFTGMYGDGSALLSDNGLLWIVSGVILLNLGIIYRGISRGIEMFSRWFMPLLLLISLVLLVRILCIGTPDPSYPDRSIEQGLGYMWNPGKVLVGFALETNDEQHNAEDKLNRKNLDFIVLNSLNDKGAGFRYDTNKISIIDRNGKKDYPLKSKAEVAADIVDHLVEVMKRE